MKAVLTACLSLMLLVVASAPAQANSDVHLSGGGTATISQVAFNVAIDTGGGASGSFQCLMAGRSVGAIEGMGLEHVMKVEAHPSAGYVTSGPVVHFSGPGFLIMDGSKMRAIHVSVWANVATQQFRLTVVEVGAMPVERMLTGHFDLR